ncbi:MAG: transglycosylase SLT domain-containing protein [Acidiferrobacter sp.]
MRVIALVVAVVTLAGVAQAAPLSVYRLHYQQALSALKAGEYGRFRQLYAQERGYIIRPYLRYHELKDRLRHDRPAAVARFLTRHATLPVAMRLRIAWLRYLSRHQRLRTFRAFYTPALNADPHLYCQELVAERAIGHPVLAAVQALWMTGNSLPALCQPLTQALRQSGAETAPRCWRRVRHAMRAGNSALVTRMVPRLGGAQRSWAQRWLLMQAHPAYALAHIDYPLISRRARSIVCSGVVALAYRSPTLAMRTWQQLRARYQFLGEDNEYVLRGVGLMAAADHLPQAVGWLAAANPAATDTRLQTWRVRAALRAQAWPQVLLFISAMPAAERHQKEWRYWRARALAKTGHGHQAHALLVALATHATYYGFLAADRLGTPYHITNVPLVEPAALLRTVARLPAIAMAHELYRLHQHREAWAQWWQALRGRPNAQIAAAALLAAHWGWYPGAILTATSPRAAHALAIRFPTPYRALILANARTNHLDPAWVYGIIRQESAFMLDARSDVGALGLMQLMPQTGFITAREIHLDITGDRDLITVANNVDLGTRYLADVLGQARGQEPVATAAYNAGPNAVAQWLPVRHPLAADIWIDTIPFRQTRDYVKSVLAFTAIYDFLLNGHDHALRTRMAPVPPAVELAADGH